MEPKKELVVYVLEFSEREPDGPACAENLKSSLVIDKENQTRLQHRIGQELLRQALFREYGIEISGNLEQRIEKRINGKPVLKGLPIHFNISHCRGLVACALAPCPVGVDVEGPRRVSVALIRRVCSLEEQAYIARGDTVSGAGENFVRGQRRNEAPGAWEERFLELWTLKESYLKMTGEGITQSLNSVAFRFWEEASGKTRKDWTSPGPEGWRGPADIVCSRSGNFYQMKFREHYLLSVCTERECGEPALVIV